MKEKYLNAQDNRLFGQITIITSQRTKEIGVRKVLGASVTSIAVMLTGDFFKLITLAIILVFPLSWRIRLKV